jgi:hypothetical protein
LSAEYLVLATLPLARAQEAGRRYRIAILTHTPRQDVKKEHSPFRAFLDELGHGGFVEGGNLDVDYRGFGVAPPSLEAAAIELTRARRMLSSQLDPKPRAPRSRQREASPSWRLRTTW